MSSSSGCRTGSRSGTGRDGVGESAGLGREGLGERCFFFFFFGGGGGLGGPRGGGGCPRGDGGRGRARGTDRGRGRPGRPAHLRGCRPRHACAGVGTSPPASLRPH